MAEVEPRKQAGQVADVAIADLALPRALPSVLPPQVQLLFIPPGIGDAPYLEYPECSPHSADLQAKYPWLEACRLEQEAKQAVGISGEVRLVRLLGNLSVGKATSTASLKIVKREPTPAKPIPEARTRTIPRTEDELIRATILEHSPKLRALEQQPGTYVHVIEEFPVVEIRKLGEPFAQMVIWSRGGWQPLFTPIRFRVRVNRRVIDADKKEQFRWENFAELSRMVREHMASLERINEPPP